MHCPTCTTARFLSALFIAALLVAGCGGGPPDTIDPVGSYDAYGATITADDAIPVQAVAAEADRWVGQSVKVEGVVAEVCQNSGCWLTLEVGPDSAPIRVDVPRDDDGAYVYTFPMDISGRSIVLAGMLRSGDDAVHEHGDHETGEDMDADMDGEAHAESDMDDEAHSEAEAEAMTVDLAIVAEGALVERIGT